MIPFIFFLVYVTYSIFEFKKGIEADSTLINQVDRLEKDRSVLLDRISKLEKELSEVKTERNIYKEFINDIQLNYKEIEEDNE